MLNSWHGRDTFEMSPADAERLYGLSAAAFRLKFLRHGTRTRDGRIFLDGHELRKRDGRITVVVYPPWTKDGVLCNWVPLAIAAHRLAEKPETLRRRLERLAKRPDGLVVSRRHGFCACKFGGSWFVCIDKGPKVRGG